MGGPGSADFGLSPAWGGDARCSGLVVFLLVLLIGLGLLAACLFVARVRDDEIGRPSLDAANEQLIASIGLASLVVVLSCSRWGYFGYVGEFCLAAAACAFGLVPLTGTVALLIAGRRCWLRPADTEGFRSLSIRAFFATFFACWWAIATFVLTFLGCAVCFIALDS